MQSFEEACFGQHKVAVLALHPQHHRHLLRNTESRRQYLVGVDSGKCLLELHHHWIPVATLQMSVQG
jgi:hypothetical protein